LPFSIDAALSGSIPSYTPKAPASVVATPVSAHQPLSSLEEFMPKGWFFDIHEDTPEQEAANLMEHSASVLDISSDDDLSTKNQNEDRGKENVPPPDWLASQPRMHSLDALDAGEETEIEEPVKRPRLRKFVQDAMDEDRKPLGDLAPSEFYGDGCDATSYVTVDVGIEKPSSLSKEFDFGCESPEKENVEREEEVVKEAPTVVEEKDPVVTEEVIAVFEDAPAVVDVPSTDSPSVVAAVAQVPEVPVAAL
jgi:hypothetical protein